MLSTPNAPANPAPVPSFNRFLISVDDGGGYDVYGVIGDRVCYLAEISGRWAGLGGPAVPERRFVRVKSDNSLPIGVVGAEAAARAAGRPDLPALVRRRVNGHLKCHHCGKLFRLSNNLAKHLDDVHRDSAAVIVAAYSDFPAYAQEVPHGEA